MKIYKYHSINIHLLNSLRTQTNWYSKIKYLNDPHECFYIDETNTNVYKELISTLCACCFSKNMDNILMWSHYADGHKGVCLEWEIDWDKLNNQLMPINYDNTITTLNKVERLNTGHLSLNSNTNAKFLTQKFKNWEYEEEIRTYFICEDLHKKGELNPFLGRLTSIYFGINANPEDIELVKHIVHYTSEIEYKRVHLDTNTMKMSI